MVQHAAGIVGAAQFLGQRGAAEELEALEVRNVDFIRAVGKADDQLVDYFLSDVTTVDVNFRDPYLQTAIFVAAFKGHTSIFCKLLEQGGVNINAADQHQRSAIFVAAQGGHAVIVTKLLACVDLDVNAANVEAQTALISASHKGRAFIVSKLIERNDIDLNTTEKSQGQTAVMCAAMVCHHAIVDMLAEAGAILSSDHSERSLLTLGGFGPASISEKAVMKKVLKKHGVISSNVPSNFQSKYYFQDGKGERYIQNLKHQRWLNRKALLLVIYRTYKWSIANQIEDEARRTLPPDLSDVGKFICSCWFDCAGGGNDMSNTSDTIGNGIGRLIMQYYGGFNASKSPFALRGKPKYGKLPDNAARCSGCLEVKESKVLQCCASCGVVRYCGRECQKADWKRHKCNCKIWTEEKKKKAAGGGEQKKRTVK
jgi:ankyrin repeat protein